MKLGNVPRVPVPRRHIDNIRARTTNRPPEGVTVVLFDQDAIEGEEEGNQP